MLTTAASSSRRMFCCDDDDQDDELVDYECVPLKHLAHCLIAGSLLEGDQLYPEDVHST